MTTEEKKLAEITAELVAARLQEAKDKTDTRVKWLQYLNTGILTIIFGVATMLAVQTATIKANQAATAQELIRIKTIQDINTNNIEQIDKRVTSLELNYLDYIKTWVDENFVRKTNK